MFDFALHIQIRRRDSSKEPEGEYINIHIAEQFSFMLPMKKITRRVVVNFQTAFVT